jgi:signal transduction histidine kinase
MLRIPPFPLLLGAVILAAIIPLALVAMTLKPPVADLQQLFVYMFATGVLTVGMAYWVYQRRVFQRFASLRWSLLAMIVITVLLIFVNVWITAHLMFTTEHDLVLTTGLLIFAGVVAAVSTLFIARTLRERIQELSNGVAALSRADWKTRLPVQGKDELTNLARMFNQMAAALEALDEQARQLEQTRRDLIAWVSHDLRTPLATMRAMNEAMLDGVVQDPATISRYQQNIQSEIRHLSRMIDDLFELAQLDAGHIPLNRQKTSLRDLISDTLSSMSARAAAQQVSLTATVDPGVNMVNIAPDKIQRVLDNLIDNALQYTPPGGRVTLKACPTKAAVEISVHNTGSYITPVDLPNVFISFYRGEQSRAQNDGRRGTGLGLAIVRAFVEAHGGTIRVESREDQGTTFTFTLPADSS